MKKTKAIAVSLLLATTACTEQGGMDMQLLQQPEVIGFAVGAAGGGFLGSMVGSGSAQLAYTALGAVGGGILGMMYAQNMNPIDRAHYEHTAISALDQHPDGRMGEWSNPQTGNGGVFTPVRSYMSLDGRYCREFRAVTSLEQGVHRERGTMCQQPNGTWAWIGGEVG